jgi:hypothetical protein
MIRCERPIFLPLPSNDSSNPETSVASVLNKRVRSIATPRLATPTCERRRLTPKPGQTGRRKSCFACCVGLTNRKSDRTHASENARDRFLQTRQKQPIRRFASTFRPLDWADITKINNRGQHFFRPFRTKPRKILPSYHPGISCHLTS